MKRAFIAGALALLFVPVAAAPKGETLEAYAEWHKGHDLIVDGQRVAADNRTRFKGSFRNLDSIPLGYEVTVQGTRLADGRILAQQIEPRANGTAIGEPQIRQATHETEAKWLKAGKVSETDAQGKELVIGNVVNSPAHSWRIVPSYINPSCLRGRVRREPRAGLVAALQRQVRQPELRPQLLHGRSLDGRGTHPQPPARNPTQLLAPAHVTGEDLSDR